MTTVSVLVPTKVVLSDILSSSVAEPLAADFLLDGVTYALKENAWSATAIYAVGDKVYRPTTHKVYAAKLAVNPARTIVPEKDGAYWIEYGPTQLFAPFDSVTNTKAYGNGSLTYSIQVGFCNAICFYGLDGATLQVQGYTDTVANGGVLFYDSGLLDIQEPAFDEYDYLFGQVYPLARYVLSNLVPYPNARFDITISAVAGQLVTLGTMAFGDLVSLVPSDPTWGGPNVGATAEPQSSAYVKVDDDGSASIRGSFPSTDLHCDLQIPIASADTSLQILQRVLDVPACWVLSDVPGYGGLNTYGLGSGKLAYNEEFALWTIDVKGLS